MVEVEPGQIYWLRPDSTVGREQSGRRPAVVVSGHGFNEAITMLAWVVPVTTRDRGLNNHVPLLGPTGLGRQSFGMTEQLRVISRERIDGLIGRVDAQTLAHIRQQILDFLYD